MNINKSIEHLERYSKYGMSLPINEMKEAARIGSEALKLISQGPDGIRWHQEAIEKLLNTEPTS